MTKSKQNHESEQLAVAATPKTARPVRLFQAVLNQFLRGKKDDTLEMRIGYYFRDPELLAQAVVHRSWIVGRDLEYYQTNERLEFLGDSVLNMLVTDYLYHLFPKLPEGDLSKKKGAIVSGKALAESARLWGLGSFLRVGKGEAKGGGREKESLLADAFESVIGAVYLDGGIEPCRKVLEKALFPSIERILSDEDFVNYKSLLLESMQAKSLGMPEYQVLEEAGPEHQKIFHIQVILNGEVCGKGQGASKKKAEQEAARAALSALGLAN
jgi:ribonuclease-3